MGGRASYGWGRWLFLRALAGIHVLAFLSLAPQVEGLLGASGILPAAQYLDRLTQGFGPERYHLVPTILWLSASDPVLLGLCLVGAALGLLALFGVWPRLCFGLLWVLYLSISTVGRAFLAFQWDILLLEATVVAVLLAPRGWRPGLGEDDPPRPLALFLGRLLLFKLMFLSGYAKLMSGDMTWRQLSALTFHYETQPLPTVLAWYAHQLPLPFQQFSAVLMFGIQLGVPFLLFTPWRRWAFGPLVGLQLLIALTGNYGFFNPLAITLCFLVLDDDRLRARLPAQWRALSRPFAPRPRRARLQDVAIGLVLALEVGLLWGRLLGADLLPGPVEKVIAWTRPFRSVNNYGLFAVMTTDRQEIVLEGSRDGVHWQPYVLPFQPGPLDRAPAWVSPHMPRLDWQMWFAALSDYRQSPWIVSLSSRLLEGVPVVIGLYATDPFGEDPPEQVRATLYRYRFTTWQERAATGAWWKREEVGPYFPPHSLSGTLGPP